MGVMQRVRGNPEWWQVRDRDQINGILAASPDVGSATVTVVDALDRPVPRLDWLPEPPATSTPASLKPRAQRQLIDEWRAAVLAEAGAPTWTDRLAQEVPLLTTLATALEQLVRSVATGRAIKQSLRQQLELVGKRATQLPPEPADATAPQLGSRFGAAAEPDPVFTLLADPSRLLLGALRDDEMRAGVMAHRLWRITADLQMAERWMLLPGAQEAGIACARVAAALYALRATASEHARGNSRGRDAIRIAAAHAHDADLARVTTGAAREAGDVRLTRIAGQLEVALTEGGTSCAVRIIDDEVDHPAIVWPPGVLLATVELSSAADWTSTVRRLVAARNEVVEPNREVTAGFRVAGNVSDHLSGQVAREWWPRRGIPTIAGLATAPEPRGDAWANGLSAAADIRWARGHLEQLPDGSAIADRVRNVARDAEGRLEATCEALTDLGESSASRSLRSLADSGVLDEACGVEVGRIPLQLADHDLRSQ